MRRWREAPSEVMLVIFKFFILKRVSDGGERGEGMRERKPSQVVDGGDVGIK